MDAARGGLAIAGYRDAEVIGRGASSTVYRAVDNELARPVAIKVLLADDLDDPARKRFRREGVITANLGNHPHIVQVLATGFTGDGHPFVAMELFEQGSVADRLKTSGTFGVIETLDLGVKVADAVSAAHRAGVLHRDIKPQNILLSAYGPALGDFGIARSAANLEWSQSLDQLTPMHAAPEILLGGTSTAQSDIYSLGSTLFTMLAGRPPFAGPPGEAPLRYQVRVLQDPVPPIPRADVSPGVRALIVRCLAKAPADRFSSAAELRDVLDGQLQELRAHPQPPHPSFLAPNTVAPEASIPVVADTDDEPTVHRRPRDSATSGTPAGPPSLTASPLEPVTAACAAPPPATGAPPQVVDDDASTVWPEPPSVASFLTAQALPEGPPTAPAPSAVEPGTESTPSADLEADSSGPATICSAAPAMPSSPSMQPWPTLSEEVDDSALTVHRPITAAPADAPAPSPTPAPPHRTRRVLLAAAGSVVVIGAASSALVLGGNSAPAPLKVKSPRAVTITAADRPRNVDLTRTATGATLHWTGPVDAAYPYLVYEVTPNGSKLLGRTHAGATSLAVRGVDPTTTSDCFEIVAVLSVSKVGEPGRWCPAGESLSGS